MRSQRLNNGASATFEGSKVASESPLQMGIKLGWVASCVPALKDSERRALFRTKSSKESPLIKILQICLVLVKGLETLLPMRFAPSRSEQWFALKTTFNFAINKEKNTFFTRSLRPHV